MLRTRSVVLFGLAQQRCPCRFYSTGTEYGVRSNYVRSATPAHQGTCPPPGSCHRAAPAECSFCYCVIAGSVLGKASRPPCWPLTLTSDHNQQQLFRVFPINPTQSHPIQTPNATANGSTHRPGHPHTRRLAPCTSHTGDHRCVVPRSRPTVHAQAAGRTAFARPVWGMGCRPPFAAEKQKRIGRQLLRRLPRASLRVWRRTREAARLDGSGGSLVTSARAVRGNCTRRGLKSTAF